MTNEYVMCFACVRAHVRSCLKVNAYLIHTHNVSRVPFLLKKTKLVLLELLNGSGDGGHACVIGNDENANRG